MIFIIVGAIAGWLAGVVVKGGGYGLIGDIVVGIIGGFIAGWLLPGLHLGLTGILGSIVYSAIGAIILLFVIRLIKRA
ncbi:MAG: GlsB/YeaQ/YmgE family stress response membrane protein [Rudaea sp.]